MPQITGFNDEEYKAIKAAAKIELADVPHSIKRHKQGYAYQQISINATKSVKYHWTNDQIDQVIAFYDRHNLYNSMFELLRKKSSIIILRYSYSHNFCYLAQKKGD